MSTTFHFSAEPKTIDLKKLDSFKKIISNPKTQFFHTFERTELISSSKNIFNQFKDRKVFVHVGIGGSSLGPEMLVSALKKNDLKFIFINNIDPDEIYTQLKDLNPSECLFYFVSKSGGTAETMAALSIVTNFLSSKNISNSDLKNYYVFATDPKKSELLDLAKELEVTHLEVPSDVGGRFCALTPVGFLPALFAGIDVEQLVSGAKQAQKMCLMESVENPLLKTAEFLFSLKKEKEIDQTVMMPYSSKLRSFSFWFTQLWAESLGKKKNLKGETVNVGFTPIVGFGATDQHSQMQLFMEGPNDKCLILLEVLNFDHDYKLASPLKSKTQEKLSGFSLAQLMKAELAGTLKALAENDRPTLHITIERNDELHMGELIVFFESLTALMGDYLMIDPFDQPGVEAGKIYAFHFLNQLK
ncbi:MAG: glucose-6-phosphate isomerase [Bacteriovorax sp.]